MKKLSTFFIALLLTLSSLTYGALPSKVYSPYVDVMLYPTFNLVGGLNATGQKYYTLAFIVSGSDGQPSWGGITALSANFMLDQVNSLRAAGGDVIVSFGGANGTPIDVNITNVNSLVTAYSAVIDKYSLTWIDFDIEGSWIADAASIDRRNQAAKLLQSKYPGLRITYCLPALPSGLTQDGINVINKAKAAGVNIYGVNVMAMDYGQPNSTMGASAISAGQNTHNQTGLNVGITPMIGQNDSQNEIFTLANASEVLSFANSNSYVNMLAMWSISRDNGNCPGQTWASATCSGISQNQYAFVNVFKSFSGAGGCSSSTITPYLQVNGAAWQNTSSTSIAVGGSITLGPQPTDGSWKWSGPNGFSSTNREISISNIQSNQGGNYVGTYTNPGGCNSTVTFTINVTGGCTPSTITPYLQVNGGAWQSTFSTTLSAGGSVALGPQPIDGTWRWTGPNGFNSSSREVSLSNIQSSQSGNYIGTYTNTAGCNSSVTFAITVPLSNNLIVKLEAENYNNMSGVQTEACSEGTLDVAYIDAGDWMVYNSITFPSTGSYTIQYRLASLNGGTLSCDLNGGAIQLGQASIPSTGGWQNWTIVNQTVTVTAGTYNLGINAQTGGWNINWLSIYQGVVKSAQINEDALSTEKTKDVTIFPNPANDEISITNTTANTIISIYDIYGKLILKTNPIEENGKYNINIKDLKAGTYLIKTGNYLSKTLKLIKQ